MKFRWPLGGPRRRRASLLAAAPTVQVALDVSEPPAIIAPEAAPPPRGRSGSGRQAALDAEAPAPPRQRAPGHAGRGGSSGALRQRPARRRWRREPVARARSGSGRQAPLETAPKLEPTPRPRKVSGTGGANSRRRLRRRRSGFLRARGRPVQARGDRELRRPGSGQQPPGAQAPAQEAAEPALPAQLCQRTSMRPIGLAKRNVSEPDPRRRTHCPTAPGTGWCRSS